MPDAPFLTPPQVARLLAVRQGKVLTWIARGELRASNVADRASGRPRWRIARADLDAFLARRACQAAPAIRRRRKAERPAGWVNYV